MATVIDTPEGIKFFQMAARKGALKLECIGMKKRGQSAYSICKQVYGLKGSKVSVLSQMEAMVEGVLAARRGELRIVWISSGTYPLAVRQAFLYGYEGLWK